MDNLIIKYYYIGNIDIRPAIEINYIFEITEYIFIENNIIKIFHLISCNCKMFSLIIFITSDRLDNCRINVKFKGYNL